MSVLETWRNEIDLPVLQIRRYVVPDFSNFPLMETRGPSGISPTFDAIGTPYAAVRLQPGPLRSVIPRSRRHVTAGQGVPAARPPTNERMASPHGIVPTN